MTTNLTPCAAKISEAIWGLRAEAQKAETVEAQLAIENVASTLETALKQIRFIVSPDWFKQ